MNGIVQAISFVGAVLFKLVWAIWFWVWTTPWDELLAMVVGIGLITVIARNARAQPPSHHWS